MPEPVRSKWAHFFEDLERRGILQPLIVWLDEQIAAEDHKFKVLARKTLITDAEKLAELHALQGCLSAFAKIRGRMRTLGTRPTATPIRPPTGTDSD